MGSTMLSDDVTLPPHSISTRLELLPQQSEIGEGLQIGKHDLNSKVVTAYFERPLICANESYSWTKPRSF